MAGAPKIKGYAYNENFGNTFRVEDGVIKVGYEAYDQFNDRFDIFFTKRLIAIIYWG